MGQGKDVRVGEGVELVRGGPLVCLWSFYFFSSGATLSVSIDRREGGLQVSVSD